jgi:flavorubredoxin
MAAVQPALPRRIAEDIHWLGACTESVLNGQPIHGSNHQFLVLGQSATLLVDTGFPSIWPKVEAQLDMLLAGRPLDWVFPTHEEIPHCGNIPKLLSKFPDARVIGDLRDYHLYFPELADRLVMKQAGDTIDLGGGFRFRFLQAVIRDLESTLWGYEESQHVLFSSDGFQHTHFGPMTGETDMAVHLPGQCAMTTAEAPPVDQQLTALVQRAAFVSLRYVDPDLTYGAMERLLTTYPIRVIAPTHGFLIVDPTSVIDTFRAINRKVSQSEVEPSFKPLSLLGQPADRDLGPARGG